MKPPRTTTRLATVPLVLGDYPARLRRIADWIDQTVRVGTDEAEQLRSDAAMLDNLTLAIVARMKDAR